MSIIASSPDTSPKGWPVRRFADVLAEPVRNGIYKKKEFHGRGCRIVNMGELFDNEFISDQEMKRVELNDDELTKYLLQEGDLVFARRSLVLEGSGKCSLVTELSEATTFESSIIRARPDQTKVSSRFYYYFMKSPLGRGLMASIATRTAVSGIRGSELAQLWIPVPPLPTQRKIAAILSAYDDLIENNTRRIAILEDMARLLYRDWFVHFHFPGHHHVPIVDSPLGPIPEGWEVRAFTDIIDVLSGGTPKTSIPEFWGGEIPWFTPRDIGSSFYVLSTERMITELGLSRCNSRLYPPDTVFITARGTVGRCVMAAVPMAMSQTSYALVGRDGFPQHLVYLLTLNMVRALQQSATGAVFDTIIVDTFRKQSVVAPPKGLQEQFAATVAPVFAMIKSLQSRNANLRRTRDLLLPRLISGRLDVSELPIDTGELDA